MTNRCLPWWFLALLLAVLAPVRGFAQTGGRVVVVPEAVENVGDQEMRAADLIESALAARRMRLVSMHEARDRVLALSRPPVTTDNSDLDVLAQEAQTALEHVAFGRAAAAQRSVREVLARAERALESLNRETKTARHVLDACLALVRSALARDQRRDALAEAMRCRRLVPDVAASEALHPANVIGALAEADDQLRRMRVGRLTVESTPESGCATYVNGRHLGTTRFQLDRAAAGEYRVQVECGSARGRVHIVQLGDDPVKITVDTEFDRALRSEERLALVYPSAKLRDSLTAAHGGALGKLAAADDVVFVVIEGPKAHLTRVGGHPAKVLGRASFGWLAAEDAHDPELARALDALCEGRDAEPAQPARPVPVAVSEPADSTGGAEPAIHNAPLTLDPQRTDGIAERHPRLRRLRIGAGALAVAGGALFATGVYFEHTRKSADDSLQRIDPNDPAQAGKFADQQASYDNAARLRWLGLPGGVLMASAVPLLRVDLSRGVPWWSYALGGAGLGLAGWGAFELSRNGECRLELTTGGCARTRESRGRGELAISAALPLATFPVAHLIEWALGRRGGSAHAWGLPTRDGFMVGMTKEMGAW
jgi:hypothetical protein